MFNINSEYNPLKMRESKMEKLGISEIEYIKTVIGKSFLNIIGYTDKIVLIKTGEKDRFNELINVKTIKINRPEIVI